MNKALSSVVFLIFWSQLFSQIRVGDPGVTFDQTIIDNNQSCYPQMQRWANAGVMGGIPYITDFDQTATINPGNTSSINTAINAMSNSLSGNERGLITLTNGDYAVNEQVIMKSNVSLIGESRDGVRLKISMNGSVGILFSNIEYAGLYNLTIEGTWGTPAYNWNYNLNANDELPNIDNISVRMRGSTRNCWLDKVNIINSARDPIRVVAEHNTLRDLYVDGAHKKAGGAQGYFFIQSRDNLITGCYITHLRHISLQGSNVEYNVVYDNQFDQEVSFHSGDNGNNLIANNTITLPADMSPVAPGEADDVTPLEARTNSPTYFAIMGPWSNQHEVSADFNYVINNDCTQLNHNFGPQNPWSEEGLVYRGPLEIGNNPQEHINNFPMAPSACRYPEGGRLYPINIGNCNAGGVCDDGNPATSNDVYNSNCECQGNIVTTSTIISGELKKWHKLTLDFEGPDTSEDASINPFTNYRMQVVFTNGSKTYNVPGFYATDGNSHNTSAANGNMWRVHFVPDEIGTWNYAVSFRTGNDIAINLNPNAGSSAGFMDGLSGSFTIEPTDKTGRDFRATGRLEYVGEHYLKAQETGEYFIKGGSDAPENTLAYDDFDAVPNRGNRRKNWNPHQVDYDPSTAADFTWDNGKGTELLGVLNYLHNTGLNAFSFLTFSLHGDDENVFPHLLRVPVSTYNTFNDAQQWNQGVHHDRFDVSRLAQWEQIFEYADRKGLYMHFKTLETENDNIMDNNAFGRERRLYYRELIARFGHHLGLNWNLSEEITLSAQVINQTADYVKAIDPYDHIVVFHTFFDQQNRYNNHYGPNSSIDGASVQSGAENYNEVREWVSDQVINSRDAGKKWVVALDEPGSPSTGVDADPNDIGLVRNRVVWNTLLAGGAGVEFYYGSQTGCTDLNCQNHRSREQKYQQLAIALEFFREYVPFQEMEQNDDITATTIDYVFSKENEIYVVYLPNGGSTQIDLPQGGDWQVAWFNPRTGGTLSATTPVSNQLVAPDNNDWVAHITPGNTSTCETIGMPCDDGDGCTTNDVYNFNCECQGTLGGVDTVNLFPIDDAYLQGNTRFNTQDLRVENGNRITYLKYDLSSVSEAINEITLQLSVGSDAGNGDINVYASNQVNWNENNLTVNNAPGTDQLVGSFSGNYPIGSVNTTILNNINSTGQFSLILVQQNGNDVSFNSSEVGNVSNRPTLIVSIDNSDCTDMDPDETPDETEECEGFSEVNGLVIIEAENIPLGSTQWDIQNIFDDASQEEYIRWTGNDNFGTPGNGLIETSITINTPGTYRFRWRNRIGEGSNTTEYNDSWLRFPDADNFFGMRNNGSIVFPHGSGQTPTPNGAGADGWFKVFLSGSALWTWSTNTSDNDSHNIFVTFDNPGIYTMQISGRSSGHNIDRIVLSLPNAQDPLNLLNDETPCENGETTCEPGASCDDGDACTTGDVYDAACNCVGTFQDADNDGVCDADDICAEGDDNEDSDEDGIPDVCDDCSTVGQACDDGDACTTGDVYDVACNCVGTFQDADNDGVCDADDICAEGDDNEDSDDDGIPDACDTLSLNDIENNFEFRVYPNPTSGSVTISFNEFITERNTLKIVDILGRVLQSQRIANLDANQSMSLDLQAYADGMYFLIISTEEKQIGITKIMVSK